MPASIPPTEALNEFLGATTRHVRRIEIYEADGKTRWIKDNVGRLKDGSVTVDYSRDERRALDLTLSNDDGVLINAPGEFWYDKIIKVYRGVQVNQAKRLPKILIASDSTTTPWGPSLRAAFAAIGFGDVQINVLAANYAIDLAPFDIIIALGAQGKGALLNQAYNAGKSVFVFREGAQEFFDAMLGAAWTGVVSNLTDYKERRRNQILDPSVATGVGWSVYAPTGTAAGTVPATGGFLGTTFYRATWSVASTSVGGGIFATTADVITPGQTYTGSMYVRSSIAQTLQIGIDWKTVGGGTLLSSTKATAIALPANTWIRLSVTGLAPATTGRAVLTVYATGVVWSAASTLDGDAALFEQATTLGDYFDGSLPATKTQTFAWTNNANQSPSIMSSGYIETRRNMVPNPLFSTATTGWAAAYGTTGAGTLTRVATGGPAASPTFGRITYTTAQTVANGSLMADGRVIATLANAGTTYSGAVQARSSVAQRLAATISWYNASGVLISSATGTQVVVVANTWTALTVTGAVAPAGTVFVAVGVAEVTGTGSVLYAAGATLDATLGQLEVGATVGTYFDGSTTDALPYAYEWTGTANSSASVQRQVQYATSISPNPSNDPRSVGWKTYTIQSDTTSFKAPTAATMTGIFGVAYMPGRTDTFAISSGTNAVGGKFMAVHYPLTNAQYADSLFQQMLWVAVTWLNPVVPLKTWEVQIGEFMIDRINESDFPFEMKITGRDYTKKCLLSKYAQATQFDAGQTLEGLIGVIATAAGITKKLLPSTGIVVGQSFFFERNVSRWEAMKKIATAYNYEIFFDASGYLVIRPFRDPTTSAPVVWVNTGKDGQVASYAKSTSDASLFNHVLVAGESSDQTIPPVFAESKNTNPNSKTNIATIGDRYWEYTSPLITTTAQAQALADSYLAIHSLEEFELTFETLMLPWLEAGDILGWIDPRPNPGDPRTFLLSSLSLSLGLSPMSAVAKRVLIVGF